jgi:peptidyl-prolyl isomerase E (cyclophilin E)
MEEGSKSKKTVFVGGIADEIDESFIYEKFSTFGACVSMSKEHTAITARFHLGDIVDVQLPSAATNPTQEAGEFSPCHSVFCANTCVSLESKHRGFAFVTYGSTADAQDAIDNMDLNEMQGRVIKVNLARPMKGPVQPGGNRAGGLLRSLPYTFLFILYRTQVWESEEWLQQNVKPLAQSGGMYPRYLSPPFGDFHFIAL